MIVHVERYLQSCDIYMSSEVQRHKSYGNIQVLPVFTHNWKDLSIDFVTRLPKRSRDWREVEYDAILVIVHRLIKIVYYELVLTIFIDKQLVKILIEAIIKYHGLPDCIITDWGSLFTSKFWFYFCYYLNVKLQISTALHPQTNG